MLRAGSNRLKGGSLLTGEDPYQISFFSFFTECGSEFERVLHFVVTVVIKQQIDPQFSIVSPIRQLVGMQGDLKAVTALVRNNSFDPVLFRVMTGEKYRRYSETKLMG